jgi:hypothetical protein
MTISAGTHGAPIAKEQIQVSASEYIDPGLTDPEEVGLSVREK